MLLTTRMVAKIVRPDIALGSAVRTEGVANTFVSTKLPAPIVRLRRYFILELLEGIFGP